MQGELRCVVLAVDNEAQILIGWDSLGRAWSKSIEGSGWHRDSRHDWGEGIRPLRHPASYGGNDAPF